MKKSGHGKNNKKKKNQETEKKMETKIIELESKNRKKIYEKNLA